jgi:hypothetical protein
VVGVNGNYWSSSVMGAGSYYFIISSGAGPNPGSRSYGASIRCIKEYTLIQGSIDSLQLHGNQGSLIAGTPPQFTYSHFRYTDGNGGFHNGQIVNSTGVLGLTATLTPDTFEYGSGVLTYHITGTPTTSGIATFNINIGGQTYVLNLNVN